MGRDIKAVIVAHAQLRYMSTWYFDNVKVSGR